MNSNIRIEKQCQVCGKTFIAKTTTTKNCSDPCAKKAYKLRKKLGSVPPPTTHTTPQTTSNNTATIQEIQAREFLSIKEVSTLIGASRWTIDRLIKAGKIKVTKLGRRSIIKRSEIDKIFNA